MTVSISLCKYSLLDLIFTVAGFCTFLIDVGTDFWVAKEFFLHANFLWFCLWIAFMVSSSIVAQTFSWLWYKYDRKPENFDVRTFTENVFFGSETFLRYSCFLHIVQLGFFFRYISAIWQGLHVWCLGKQSSDYAVYMSHDLSMLRLMETFCESVPQLTLMIYILLLSSPAGVFQCVSAVASMVSIAWMVVDYHRSLRSFLPDKAKQGWGSSVVYFLWNLLLISQRVCSLALFAYVLPCCLIYHFLLLWLSLVLWAHWQHTAFMDSVGGEWVYRAIVGLIWYFSWFNVVEGHTRSRSTIYHTFMATDGAILIVTWWFYRDLEETQHYAVWLVSALVVVYILGILLKVLYYCCFHPTLFLPPIGRGGADLPDGQVALLWQNQRMACHASCFYAADHPALLSRNVNRAASLW